MKIQIKLAALLILATFNLKPSTAHAQGALTPPGVPAPTMKTLDQIESRTPISTAPYSISTSGSYYLTTNLTVFTGNAIIIGANNVTLDLNGFTISSTQNPASTGKGIALGNGSGPVANVTIRNGFITGGVTNNGTTFSGSGFGYGIFQFGGLPSANVHVSGVTVSSCLAFGINLGSSNTVVESCIVNMAGTTGIYAQSISSSTAINCGSYGIFATDSANDCSGAGIINGSGVSAVNANNCRGTGSGSGAGVISTVANSCRGNALNTGTGLSGNIAINCFGASGTGAGLTANTALNCYGSSSGQSAYGIYANSAQNSYGANSSFGIGIYATGNAIGCIGSCSGGIGLYAFIANSCKGITTSGTGLSTDHNVNSY